MKFSKLGLAALAWAALFTSSATATEYSIGSAPYNGLFIGESATFSDFNTTMGPTTYVNPAGTLQVSYVGTVDSVLSFKAGSDHSWAPFGASGFTSFKVLGDYAVEAISFDFGHSFTS